MQSLVLILFAVGYGVAFWAMRVNPFFSTFARHQRERGHHVVTSGPYALVRHPGYAGVIFAHLALPIAIGSVWALAPTAWGAVMFVLRAASEDRMLDRSLPGYGAYRDRVRWRLIPHVW